MDPHYARLCMQSGAVLTSDTEAGSELQAQPKEYSLDRSSVEDCFRCIPQMLQRLPVFVGAPGVHPCGVLAWCLVSNASSSISVLLCFV